MRFAEEVGAIDEEESCSRRASVWRGLCEAAAEDGHDGRGESDSEGFLALLHGALASGQAHVVDAKDGGPPPLGQGALGWATNFVGTGDRQRVRFEPRGEKLGWIEGEALYLEPEVAYRVAQQMARSHGEGLTASKRSLFKQLRDCGLLEADTRNETEGKNRFTVRKSCEKVRREVLGLRVSDVFGDDVSLAPPPIVYDEDADEDDDEDAEEEAGTAA
jgi:hypothetical protein